MSKKSLPSRAALYVSLLAFISFVVYILHINGEVLYTAHDRSEFIFGAPFFHTLLSKPFGPVQYVGAWLTQLFFKPAIGTGVMATIWILIFCVGAKAFRLRGNTSALMLLPIACLLTSVVDLGYWIYIYPVRGYWFSQSVGYLVMLLLLWAARCTSRKWHLVWYLIAVCSYPVLGWFALLFILCLALAEKPTWRELLGIFLLVLTASIWHTLLYKNLKIDDVVLAGFPRFETGVDASPRLAFPFWVLGAISVLIPLIQGLMVRKAPHPSSLNPPPSSLSLFTSYIIPLTSCIAGIVFTLSLMYHDRNYTDEMRMVRYASDDNWQGVLRLAEENKQPTCTMVFLKNVALMHEGGLLDRSFKLNNICTNLNNPDSLHVTLLNIASPLVYYNYGMMNEAIRLSYENAIPAGFSPFYLKMLSRCALACGDEKLLERYTTLLHHMPSYANWQPAPVSEKVNELMKSYPDEITGVENSDSYVVNSVSLWYESDSKVASEQALFYAMLRCDARPFWPSMRNYVQRHMNEEFPLHAMEAYILFMDKAPEEKRMMLPVEEGVYNRYKQFCETLARLVKPGKTVGNVAEEMRKEWGDTYWYYYYFGRQYSNSFSRKNNEIAS